MKEILQQLKDAKISMTKAYCDLKGHGKFTADEIDELDYALNEIGSELNDLRRIQDNN